MYLKRAGPRCTPPNLVRVRVGVEVRVRVRVRVRVGVRVRVRVRVRVKVRVSSEPARHNDQHVVRALEIEKPRQLLPGWSKAVKSAAFRRRLARAPEAVTGRPVG